ncbi:MAG: hypothetical protein VX910_02845 [Candidatus Latescibacterota bacterium]|nr:hypothetical protein [Candidatus Latescibacterota bacterium]
MSAQTTRLDVAARWITIALNPAVVSVLAFLFLDGYPEAGSWKWIVLATILGPGVPSGYAIYLYVKGEATSVFLPDPRDRMIPLFLAAGSCCVGVWMLTSFSGPTYAVVLMSAYILIAFVSAILSRRWRISLHTAGICAPWFVGMTFIGVEYVWAFPAPLVIGWSRVRVRGHTLNQVLAGAAIGGVSVLVAWWFITQLGSEF